MERLQTARPEIEWPVTEGDDWTLRWRMKRNGAPIPNFDGYEFYGAVRTSPWAKPGAEPLLVIEFDLTEGGGWVTARVPRAQTIGTGGKDLYYEIKWSYPTSGGNSDVRALFGGRMPVTRQIVEVAP